MPKPYVPRLLSAGMRSLLADCYSKDAANNFMNVTTPHVHLPCISEEMASKIEPHLRWVINFVKLLTMRYDIEHQA